MRINYRGFDDDVIKLIEMGDTDLSLSGAQLMSYSGSAAGLFGIKVLAATGPLDLTFIASKEEGETASKSYSSSGGAYSTTTIADYNFLDRQFFFFENPGKDFLTPRAGFRDVYPVVGADASSSDEIEVFVSLKPAEYSDATIFKYGAKAYADTLNNGLDDDMDGKPFRSLVKQLFLEEGDFALIQDYSIEGGDVRYVGIQLASPLDESRALMVRYKARHMASGPQQGEEFLVGDYMREPESETDSLVAEIICYPKDATTGSRSTDPTWNMMMRNVYSLGSSQIDLNSLVVRIENTENVDNNYLEPISNLNYLRIFGLDQVVNSTGEKGADDLIDNTTGILDLEQGYLMFPWYEPFNPPEGEVRKVLSAADTTGMNFDYTKVDFSKGLYESALTDLVKNSNHFYNIIVESSSGQRVFQLSSYDIIEGSEVVTVDGTRLVRGTDYDIDYSSGIVTLKASILPDSKINIDYQHSSLVGGGKNSLLGIGANLNLSQNFRLSGMFLYSSMGAPKYTPRLGEEPTRTMATDLNGSFILYPRWMTTVANLLPRVDTDAKSSLSLGGEIAVSLPNPNVKGKAIVDDMEGVEEATQVDFQRRSWNEASPAYDALGVRHGPASEAAFYWYNAARTAKQEYFISSKRDLNPALDERENSTLQTMFLDVVEPELDQWCGVMAGFSGGGLDLSTAQFLEVWVNDFDTTAANRGGTVHIDFGRIDEDFYKPDSNGFDNEDKLPYGWTIDEDIGFEDESCTYPSDLVDSYWDDNHYVYHGINCRRGNGAFDSEDLNGNGYLDEINTYYTVSFNLADSADVDIQRDYSKHAYSDYWNDKQLNPRKAWRKYRIDLSKAKTVFGEPRIDAIQHMRIWIEGVDSLITFNDSRLIEFAEMKFVGSRWEFNGIRNLADSLDSSGAAPGQRLIVGTINNKDDASHYEPPYQVQQEEGIDNKEGSLRLNFENFAGHTSFRAVKRFYGSGQDYGQYRDLEFFVRPNYNVDDADDVEFYLQIAYDSTKYYEIEVPLTSSLSREWIAVNINLSDLTNIKLEAEDLGVNVVTKTIRDKVSGRAYNATLRGSPTLFNVRFLYIGLRNRAGSTVDEGEVWFNDIRLGGVRKDIDHAENGRFAADFAGVLQLNGSMTRSGPEFHSLRQTSGSGYTSSSYNLGAKTSLGNFIPTARFDLPISLQYTSSRTLPKYKLNSDVEIMDAEIRKSLESVSASYGFNVSMSRRGSSNYLMRNIFDNLKTSYSYSKRGSRTPTTRDTTVTMSGNLNYQMQFHTKRELSILRGIKWRYWLSNLSYETSASRQTKQGYTLSGDTVFVKRPFNYSANWHNTVNSLYEPFESIKINFSLEEHRDLGVDHDFHGLPIGTETSFNHNLSLVYQPSSQMFFLSEFNPRFEFKSRYSEDLSASNRQMRSSYYDTTYVTTCDPETDECFTERVIKRVSIYDPFGTRGMNNGRSMTFAFSVDTGKYIMRLGQLFNLIGKDEKVTRRGYHFNEERKRPTTAEERAKEMMEKQKQKQKKADAKDLVKDLTVEEEEETPPPQEGVPPSEPAGTQQGQESKKGGLGDLGVRRSTPAEGAAVPDTAAAIAKASSKSAQDPFKPVKRLIRFMSSM
ncbi:MAG: cell surface protein SprA, partial [Candidatus Krumholzibacteria bacterium]|nr:cell surface protein SprA [Candidatus Krumholzibacteria bacterium]